MRMTKDEIDKKFDETILEHLDTWWNREVEKTKKYFEELSKMKRVLRLPVKAEYFNQIKAGTKIEEYRIIKEYWSKRLIKEYDEVWVTLGYPSSDETDKIIKFKWTGYEIKKITHKEFGNKEVDVYAIQLEEKIN